MGCSLLQLIPSLISHCDCTIAADWRRRLASALIRSRCQEALVVLQGSQLIHLVNSLAYDWFPAGKIPFAKDYAISRRAKPAIAGARKCL